MNKDNVLNDDEINLQYFEVNDDLENTIDLTEIVNNLNNDGDNDE